MQKRDDPRDDLRENHFSLLLVFMTSKFRKKTEKILTVESYF